MRCANSNEKVRRMIEVEERYNQIRNRHSALERVLKLAIVIEQLNNTLEGVLISGEVEGALPQQAARFYDQLTEYYRSLPNEVVQKLLDNLELGVSNNLLPILQITRIASGSDESLSLPGNEEDSSPIRKRVFREHQATDRTANTALQARGAHPQTAPGTAPTHHRVKGAEAGGTGEALS
jgi:hypothetical protein